MFTKWQQVESWIRDNGLNSWRFSYDRTGAQTDSDGNTEQKRSNRMAIVSDYFPGSLDEKIALTHKRLSEESNQLLYGYGKRGKENTGLMYCEVRLVDELQQPGTQAVSSLPISAPFDEEKMMERIRKEVQLEYENQRYKEERKQFEADKKKFEEEKNSAIGTFARLMSPVVAAISGKQQRVCAGVDADAPVEAQPIHAVEQEDDFVDVFTDEEYDELFALIARFKAVEPRYIELIKSVVAMAERKDPTYDMAKGFLLK